MDIGSIESGKLMVKVLTTNEINLTILPKPNLMEKIKYPGVAANRVVGEHGLSMIIKITDGEKTQNILIDTGGLAGTIIENSKQFNIDLSEVDKMIITHGHFDHFGSLTKVIPLLKEGTEFYLNPFCYEQFYGAVTKSGEVIPAEELPTVLKEKKDIFALIGKMPLLSKNMVSNLANQNGVKIIETNEPVQLYDGIITSGEIEFGIDEESKERIRQIYKKIDERREVIIQHFKCEEVVLG